MNEAFLLPGIRQYTIKTDRLTVAYLQAGEGDDPHRPGPWEYLVVLLLPGFYAVIG